jgi:hypothetical protein
MAEGRRQGHRVLAYEVWRMAMGDGDEQQAGGKRTSDGQPVTVVKGEQAAQVWDAATRYFSK